jgi:hypothetical protein
MDPRQLVDHILASPEWARADAWGDARPGHPEGSVGRHVREQVLPFIDQWYRDLPDYWSLVALAYLHDIGKPDVVFEDGHVRGEPHSILSQRIAGRLGAPERLQHIIRVNDRAYSHWRRLQDKRGQGTAERWTPDRRKQFVDEFGDASVDLPLCVLFHRADNGYRRAPERRHDVDAVAWFEDTLVAEGLMSHPPPQGRDQRLTWSPRSPP